MNSRGVLNFVLGATNWCRRATHSRALILGCVLMACSSSGLGNDSRYEVIPFVGVTGNQSVDIEPIVSPEASLTRIRAKRSVAWGFSFNAAANETVSLGFTFSGLPSKLQGRINLPEAVPLGGQSLVSGGYADVADMNIFNYHATVTIHGGEADSTVRPYLVGGLGVTSFRPKNPQLVAVPLVSQSSGDIESLTRFSPMIGAGVKIFPGGGNIGFRFQGRWIPTRISKDARVFCSDSWIVDCIGFTERQFAHQGEFTAGVIFRF